MKFDDYYKQLNKEQRLAVDTIEGPVMVIAGPGTGKTQILTLRIANILKETQIEPENILALTFTESGVAAMRKRLAEMIGSPAYRVRISTFHGFANEVIQTHPESFPHIIGANSSTEMEQIDIMRDVIDGARLKVLKPFGDQYHYVKSARSAIKDLKKEGISPEDFKKIVADEKTAFEAIDDLYYEKGAHKGKMKGAYQTQAKDIERNLELAILYEGYQQELKKRKLYDYEDMLIECLNALGRDEELLLTIQEQYQYFLVDEHQDTNRAQNKILELLINFHDNPNIFIVGDEKQAIFRFQGASLDNFNYFKNLYPDAKLISLLQNYRSTQTILDASGNIIEHKLKSQNKYPEKLIAISEYSNPDVELYGIAKQIAEKIKAGTPASEIAVLYHENKEAFPLSRIFGKLGIPHVIESNLDILRDASVKKLLIILRALNSYGEPLPLIEAMHIDFFDIDPLDIYTITQTRQNPYEVISSKPLGHLMNMWRKIVDNGSMEELFENIIRESGLLKQIVSGDVDIFGLEKINLLYKRVKELSDSNQGLNLKDFLRYVDALIEHNVSIKYTPSYHAGERVRFMTAHGAKGLEFEHVYIINAVDKIWGNRRMFSSFNLPASVYRLREEKKNEAATDSEERNLFFVALTRAKKEARISYAHTKNDGREQLASQFLSELKPELIEHMDVSDIEKAYQRDAQTLFAPLTTKAGPSIQDRQYLKDLFLSRGFSATHLNNYLSCPWRYFYVNLLRVPQPPTTYQYYGSAMHKALEELLNGKNRTEAFLLASFEKALNVSPLHENDKEVYREKGLGALKGYYKTYQSTWKNEVLTEFAIKGIELTPEIRLTGKLDKIELLDAKNVIVTDYKTGQVRSRNYIEGNTADSKGDMKRQLVFYNLLLNRYADGKYNMKAGVIDFLEPTESGKYRQESFEITEEEIKNLEQEIRRVADEILNLKFWDMHCDDPECEWCRLRGLMK